MNIRSDYSVRHRSDSVEIQSEYGELHGRNHICEETIRGDSRNVSEVIEIRQVISMGS